MAILSLPQALRRSAPPRIEAFALLTGIEAGVRGLLIGVMPLTVYDALGDAQAVSVLYFAVGIASLLWGLMVPWATRFVPRRWMYSAGGLLYLLGMALAATGGAAGVGLALLVNALGTVTLFVCLNAYVLDYVGRADLARSTSTQMFYAATAWAVGPMLGVWLRGIWAALPFLIAAGLAGCLIAVFWWLRLGNGKQIARAKAPPPNPLAYLGRFAAQPRLVAGWLFAVIRSCGWWVYVVYLPIFCVEAGLGDRTAGAALSVSNALLFGTPAILRLVHRAGVRRTVRGGFALAAAGFLAAGLAGGWPWVAVGCVMAAAVALVVLDVAGGLPFMMAVKPSERTEMAAVYSSFRDVSGIVTPGVAWAVLLVAPLPGVFVACAAGLAAAWALAGTLHPRLGARRRQNGQGDAEGRRDLRMGPRPGRAAGGGRPTGQ